MSKNENAKKTARSVLRKYKLSVPTVDNLIFVVGSYGFDIIEYSQRKNDTSISALIENLSLSKNVQIGKAFTYCDNDVKLLFLCEDITLEEKRYALAHELGHIACSHFKHKAQVYSSVEEECEANEFAHYLLHPDLFTKILSWISTHKVFSIIAITLLAVGIVSVPVVTYLSAERQAYGDYYVSESGEKYHEKDCICIKGKSNTHKMTVEEYKSGEYEPCKICQP